jgi:ribosomal protein S18 acetylase RimI-like enzyme
MEAITDHQPPTVLVELVLELLDVGGDLGLQRRGQHLPSTIAHDLIKKRPTGRLVGRLNSWTTLSMSAPSRTSAPTPVLIRFQLLRDPPREDALLRLHPPTTTGSDHCSLHVAGMLRNRGLARALADSGMSELRRLLAYKTRWSAASWSLPIASIPRPRRARPADG